MTVMEHWLIRLRGDEDPEAWGERWTDHADRIAKLEHADGWLTPPEWLAVRGSRQLDWGASLYEVSLEDLKRLVPEPGLPWQQESWREQRARIEALDPAGRFAVVWVEMA